MTTILKIGAFVGLAMMGMGGTAAISPENTEQTNKVPLRYTASENCTIKGNISTNSGDKIYHVRGQEYYNATKIRPLLWRTMVL